MPKAKRERRERTDHYHLIQQWWYTPEQRLYEGIRPLVLFGEPARERAEEPGLIERALVPARSASTSWVRLAARRYCFSSVPKRDGDTPGMVSPRSYDALCFSLSQDFCIAVGNVSYG